MNIANSSGIPMVDTLVMPRRTPLASASSSTTHTTIIGQPAWATKSTEMPLPSAPPPSYSRNLLKKNPSASSPQAWVRENQAYIAAPGNDRRVIDRDEETDPDVDPADGLGAGVQTFERHRRGAAVLVTDGVVEQQDRDTRGQQRHQVGDEEGAAAVLVRDVGKAPDVAHPHRADKRHQDEGVAATETLSDARPRRLAHLSSRTSCCLRRRCVRYEPRQQRGMAPAKRNSALLLAHPEVVVRGHRSARVHRGPQVGQRQLPLAQIGDLHRS